jgi:hypothetical protein
MPLRTGFRMFHPEKLTDTYSEFQQNIGADRLPLPTGPILINLELQPMLKLRICYRTCNQTTVRYWYTIFLQLALMDSKRILAEDPTSCFDWNRISISLRGLRASHDIFTSNTDSREVVRSMVKEDCRHQSPHFLCHSHAMINLKTAQILSVGPAVPWLTALARHLRTYS